MILGMSRLKGWVVLAVLFAACFFTYSNSLHSPFMRDARVLLADVKVKNIKFFFNSFFYPSVSSQQQKDTFVVSGDYYRPMTYCLSILQYMAFGNDPFKYHLFNVFVFTFMCFLVYVLIDLFFQDQALAIVAAILFGVHPINLFYVNYANSAIHSCRFICMFLSMIFFWKAENEGPKYFYHLAAVSCFVIALLCHEMSLILPAYILFVSIYFSKEGPWPAALKTWPYMSVLLLYVFLRAHFIGIKGNLSNPLAHVNAQGMVFLAGAFSKVTYLYLSKLFFPDSVFFAFNVMLMKKLAYIWVGGLVALILGWGILLKRDAKSIPSFCATWLGLGLIPAAYAGLCYPHWGVIIEPQWMTFSVVAFFLAAAWVVLQGYRRYNKVIVSVVCALVLIIWATLSRYNNWVWSDEMRYYDHLNDNFSGVFFHIGYSEIADGYLQQNKPRQAKYNYLRALKEGGPKELAVAYNGLGRVDLMQKHLDQAKVNFISALKYDPKNIEAWGNLALVDMEQKDYPSAERIYKKVLKMDKYSLEARLNLAFLFTQESNYLEAIKLYNENLGIVPFEARSLLGLVNVYAHLHDMVSVKQYSRQLIDHGDDVSVLIDLGDLLGSLGQNFSADEAFRQAIRLDAHNKETYLRAGQWLAAIHEYDKAIILWKIGETIDPHDKRFNEYILKAVPSKTL